MNFSGASAQFATGSIYGTSLGSDGACTMFHNPLTAGISAGTLSVTGTAMPITLTPAGTPVKYTASMVPAQVFTAGSTITVTAPGAEFPAFSATVTAPALLDGFTTPTTISRAAGYHATWTQATGNMWLLINAAQGASDVYLLLCKVPDTGSYTVTSAALALFPQAVTTVGVALARAGENDVHLGSAEVDLVALDVELGTNNTTLTP